MVMIRYLILFSLLLLAELIHAQTGGTLKGRVLDENEKNAPVAYANIAVYKGTGENLELVDGTSSNENGEYYIPNLTAGTYVIEMTYIDFPTPLKISGVQIKSNGITPLDIKYPKLSEEDKGLKLSVVEVTAERGIVNTTENGNTKTITGEEIKKSPIRDVNGFKATKTSVVQKDVGEDTRSNGSRAGSDDTYIDGVRQFGSASVPETDIEEIQITTSGIPAEYGDATGAITNIVTKGPSNTFTGGAQVETSQYLDAFGSNRVDLSFAGPILKTDIMDSKGNKIFEKDSITKKRTLLGFRFSATGFTDKDNRPSAFSTFMLKDEVRARISANPLIPNPAGEGRVQAANYLTANDFISAKARPNVRSSYMILNGKLDFKPTNDIYISAAGQGQFTVGNSGGRANQLLNSDYNSYFTQNNVRGLLRMRHSVSSTKVKAKDSEDADSNAVQPLFQNLVYEVQLDYTQENFTSGDPRYKNNLFEYGYVGKIYRSLVPVAGFVDSVAIRNSNDSIIGYDVRLGHAANFISFNGYEAATDINPVLSSYNNLVNLSQVNSMEELEIVNGRFTGNQYSIFGLFNNAGAVAQSGDNYSKGLSQQVRGNVKVNFDLVTNRGKGKNSFRHAIQMGGTYEQRIERSYSLNPFELWTLADQTVNEHLSLAADRTSPTGETFFDPFTQRYYERFKPLIRNNAEGVPTEMSAFGSRLRTQLGKDERDWINVHELRPDQLNISLFEPTTLIQGRQAVMSYFGYDYLGNTLGTNVQFNDFFLEKVDGRYTRPVAPFKPIYTAGYIQDKFIYKDIIVQAGLRIDNYDANTKVMKDPFSVTGYYTASEFENSSSGYKAAQNPDYQRPTNVGDDYAVYVNENSPDATVVGYRKGEQWYNSVGTPVNNAGELGSNIIPALRGFGQAKIDPQGSEYNPDLAFKDYKPTPVIMPRLSFSFPIIADKSNFYANYDVLAQRPNGNNFASALTYYNFRENAANGFLPNPNLQSQKVVNYEVGYQQAINAFSRFKLSLLFREDRNQIQLKQYLFAYPIQYTTFGNDDFSTTKAFMFEYELRPKKRTTLTDKASNMKFNVSYTLQFVEGTGSSPTSTAAIGARDLKYVFPLDVDQRHTIVVSMDYRYKSGADYNGPKIGYQGKAKSKDADNADAPKETVRKTFNLFENTGINILCTSFSGSPYTRKLIPGGIGTSFGSAVTEGAISGARLPWSYRFDLRIDRDFKIGGKEKEGKKSKPIMANVYIRVQNILNTQNVLAVYPVTGSPTDDGFLTNQNSPGLNFTNLYGATYPLLYDYRMREPFNISRPRRIFLGLVFGF
jgi:Carboxypeptidase regulatory-like domain